MIKNDISLILRLINDGVPVIITDHPDREGEGDLMLAAEKSSVETLAFFARYGRGLTCLPCRGDRLERLGIPMAHSNSLDKFATPFSNSIDAARGISTGVSAGDRKITIDLFVDNASVPADFAQPGHLFPLRARDGLLLERQGHTEASVALCELAGLSPIAVIVEIMNDDGSMMKGSDLVQFASHHNLATISIDEIIDHITSR